MKLVLQALLLWTCVWNTDSIVTAASVNATSNGTHKPKIHRLAAVPHMLNHGTATHTQTHTHKQTMLNGPKSKHKKHIKDAAAQSLPGSDSPLDWDEDDTMVDFLWSEATATQAAQWLPHVGHNTRIFRAELCADRELDSKHYDDCYAFMTKFCARNDDMWSALNKGWEMTVKKFCDKFWAIGAKQEEEATTTTELTTTERPSTKPFHETMFEPVKSVGDAVGGIFTTTREFVPPPPARPVKDVEPERTEISISLMCARQRRLSGKAEAHCKRYMDKECDARDMYGRSRRLAREITQNCKDFYSYQNEEMYEDMTAKSPSSAPGPSPYVWPPVDNQKREDFDMPEQGFVGGPVQYNNGKMMTGDWGKEFGPHAGGYQSIRSICMAHPESEWCRLSGYHKPERIEEPNEFPMAMEAPKPPSPQLWVALLLLALALVIAVVLRKSSGG